MNPTAVETAEAVQTGDQSATETVDAALERIAAGDEQLNAFITLIDEEARAAARAADDPSGPLAGVPLALKDLSTEKEGVRTTFGSAALADHVSDHTAITVERLEAAGAIVVGKTNTPEFGHKGTTDNDVIGPTASPIDPSLNAGGSSGGSAAAVGAGMVPIATGSDAGGSLRIPAAMCGVVGMKPSFGLVPYAARPNAFSRHPQHTTFGPLARTVEDAAVMLDVMAGPHNRDPVSVPVDIDFVSALEREPSSLRIAFSPDLDVFDVNESVATVLEEAVGDLADAGATVDRVDIDHGYTMGELQMAVTATYTTSLREVATTVEAEFGIDLLTDESTSESLRTMLSMAEHIGANDIAESGMIRTGFFDAIQDRLDEYDLIITPTTARVEIGLEEDISTTGFDFPLTWPFNLTGHPAASVPAGLTEEGHPVGCQIIGQRYEDDTVFAGMAALERVRPWTHLYE